LGTELRRLREAVGLTGDQVIERVGWASASKLSRLENGRSRPDPQDVLDLLELYGADEETRSELSAITLAAGDIRGWLRSYPVMTQQQRSYAELEAGCAEILEYNPVLVPGLLQTAAYARARIVSARLADVDTLRRGGVEDPRPRSPPGWPAVAADPADRRTALHRRAGGGRLGSPGRSAGTDPGAAGQLCELATLPNVTLHVLLRDATIGEHYLPPTAFSLYRFADPADPETVAIEGGFTNVMSTEANTLNAYKVVFEWLCSAALSASDSLSWLIEATGRGTEEASPSTVAYGPTLAPVQRRRPTGRLTDR
jgi:transcriptional regulator with XRE-family HTH domain